MQIELFACHYANKSNGASHRDNAAVVNEPPPRSASGAPCGRVHRESRCLESRHFFATDRRRVGSPRQVADEIARGESRSGSNAHRLFLSRASLHYARGQYRGRSGKYMLNSLRARGKADLSHDYFSPPANNDVRRERGIIAAREET